MMVIQIISHRLELRSVIKSFVAVKSNYVKFTK